MSKKDYYDIDSLVNNLEINFEIKPSFTTRKLKELQQKIDKAIEYLKTFHFIDNIRVLDIKEYEKLLKILGDEKK